MTATQSAPSGTRTTAIDPSAGAARRMRRPALVAGTGLLAMAVLAPAANFGVIQRLVTPGDATRTAGHILASAGLYRLAIAALAAVVILDIVVAWALLKFFEPVHKGLATLAGWLRISYAVIFAVAISQLMGVLPLLSSTRRLTAFSIGQRQAEALQKIHDFQDIWKVSLILFRAVPRSPRLPGLQVRLRSPACRCTARHRRRRLPHRQHRRAAQRELYGQRL
jgi:Domain of unknown function (DUF4386)